MDTPYSNGRPKHFIGGEKAGCGVHLHWHCLWGVGPEFYGLSEIEAATTIFGVWKKAVIAVVSKARKKNLEAFSWVNLDEPLKAPQFVDKKIKGAISARFIRPGSDPSEVEILLRYLIKELAFGVNKVGKNESSKSFSWGQLLGLVETELAPWARVAYRFHVYDIAHERGWAWSKSIKGESINDREILSQPEIELGASSSPADYGRVRRRTDSIRDERLHRSGAIEGEGMDGFNVDNRSQPEKMAALQLAKDRRGDGRAMYLGLIKKSTSPWVKTRLEKIGFKFDENRREYVGKIVDNGEI